jgi:hypothetical protein
MSCLANIPLEPVTLAVSAPNPMKAPIGATHFWRGGKFGHVAIQSSKPGYVWNTDLPVKDRVGKIYYTEVNERWGYKYLGWTNKLNGVDLNV